MNLKFFTIIIIFSAHFGLCQSRNYNNFSLFKVTPTEVDQLKFLQHVETKKYIDLLFWKKPYKLYGDVQFIVNPADKDLFMERANHFKMNVEKVLDDVQKAFDNQSVRRYRRLRVETFSWDNYHTLDDIYQWLADMALKYPTIVEMTSIGKSFEGRDIFIIGLNKLQAKPVVIVEGGIHGHEWVATEFITYLAFHLLHANQTRDNSNGLVKIAERYQWYLIPVVNPDGYAYSHNVDRLWRKNRRNIGTGYGVDLNRNFDYTFGQHGTSPDPNNDNYCGTGSFSEPETKALADFVSTKSKNLKFYFSIHAYGQKIVIPYADRINHIDNYAEMENYGKQAIQKMYKLNGVKYAVGTIYDTMGLRISGNSASWVKKNHKVKYVFTFLLRDNGSYGYALPDNEIVPACEEALVGLVEIMTAKPRRVRANIFSAGFTIRRSSILLFLATIVYYIF